MQKIYLLMIALAMFSFTTNAQELVVNGGFETWTVVETPDNWTADAGTVLMQEGTEVHGGASSMHVDITTGSQADTDLRQTVTVEAGKTYDVSVWVYHLDGLSKARFFVDGYLSYSDNTLIDQWQELTTQYVATVDGDIDIGFRYYDQTGFVDHSYLYVDDFSMIQNVTAPVIENIVQNPTSPTVSDAVDVMADITDNGTITSAILTWTNDGGTTPNDITMSVVSGDTYQTDTQIPAQIAGTTVSYFITAIDDNAETTASAEISYYLGDFCNGEFELWTGGVPDCWSTIDAGVTIVEENATVHGGSAAMHVNVTTAAQADTDISQIFNAEAGQTYDVSVWVYQLDTLSNARLLFGGWQGYSDKLLVDEWQEITYQFVAVATEAIEVGLRFYDQANFVDNSYMIIDDFFIQTSTGVNSVEKTALNIFPNPVKDILTIEGQNISSVEIMDINGKVVKTINAISSKKTVDVSALTQGIYFVKTTNTEGTKVSKLVKL